MMKSKENAFKVELRNVQDKVDLVLAERKGLPKNEEKAAVTQ